MKEGPTPNVATPRQGANIRRNPQWPQPPDAGAPPSFIAVRVAGPAAPSASSAPAASPPTASATPPAPAPAAAEAEADRTSLGQALALIGEASSGHATLMELAARRGLLASAPPPKKTRSAPPPPTAPRPRARRVSDAGPD